MRNTDHTAAQTTKNQNRNCAESTNARRFVSAYNMFTVSEAGSACFIEIFLFKDKNIFQYTFVQFGFNATNSPTLHLVGA